MVGWLDVPFNLSDTLWRPSIGDCLSEIGLDVRRARSIHLFRSLPRLLRYLDRLVCFYLCAVREFHEWSL